MALKNAPKKTIVKLLNIINATLRLNYFPTKWKHAIIITFQNPEKTLTFQKTTDLSAYYPNQWKSTKESSSPVSLNTSTTKRLFQMSNSVLGQHYPQKFKQWHSGRNQQTVVEKDTTAVVYLDISKAFEKVWHKDLTCKPTNAKIPTKIVKLFQCYLKTRTF